MFGSTFTAIYILLMIFEFFAKTNKNRRLRWNHKTKLIFGGGTAVIKSTEADLKRFGTIII